MLYVCGDGGVLTFVVLDSFELGALFWPLPPELWVHVPPSEPRDFFMSQVFILTLPWGSVLDYRCSWNARKR